MGSGPLFFYTGNEGAIEGFYENTGFLFELAQNFSALIVFAEHVSCKRFCSSLILTSLLCIGLHVYHISAHMDHMIAFIPVRIPFVCIQKLKYTFTKCIYCFLNYLMTSLSIR